MKGLDYYSQYLAESVDYLEPYYMTIQTLDGQKPIPYHRILLITYDGAVEFENQRIRGLADQFIEEDWQGR